jgi:hypothetical protein
VPYDAAVGIVFVVGEEVRECSCIRGSGAAECEARGVEIMGGAGVRRGCGHDDQRKRRIERF